MDGFSVCVFREGSGKRAIASISLCLLAMMGGCPLPPTDNPDEPNAPINDNTDAGFSFDTAKPIDLGGIDEATFEGDISGRSDVDMYSLGTIAAGDRVYIDVQRTGGSLDPVAALFDSRQYIYAFSDDRTPDATNLNPLMDVLVRGPEGKYFLGIVPFPNSGGTGAYRVYVKITRDVGLTPVPPQVVFLDWNGGSGLQVPNVGTFNLPAFDAASLGTAFAGLTEQLKDRVQQIVGEHFAGFNFVLLNSDDNAEPASPHSTVFFGGTNLQAFAIAEQIDTLNQDLTDNAIVYTGSFVDAFSRNPTFEQMARGIGNTTAHEIGHLLGLVHTDACAELMDTRCGNDSILAEQAFGLAPVDESVFPIGMQNATDLIGWAIGFAGL